MEDLLQLSRECFSAVSRLRALEGNSEIAPQRLHAQFVELLSEASRRAKALGMVQGEVDDTLYALVALIDETALRWPGAIRDHWVGDLLQMRQFDENVAGENFFVRLEYIRERLRRERQGVGALRVYYLCLIFGFEGRYRVGGGESELAPLRQAIARELGIGPFRGELSPSAERPSNTGFRIRRSLPLVAFAATLLGFAIFSYAMMSILLGQRRSAVLELAEQRRECVELRARGKDDALRSEEGEVEARKAVVCPRPAPFALADN